MQPSEHALLLSFVAGLASLWFGVSYMWRRTRLRAFREDVFTMRDELFDYMYQHGLSYSMPQYQQMRDMFNGSIRLVQSLRGPLVVRIVSRYADGKRGDSSLQVSIQRIEDPIVRNHFETVLSTFGLRMVTYIGVHWFLLAAFETRRRERAERTYRFQRLRTEVGADLAEEIVFYGRNDTPQARAAAKFAHAR